MGNLTFTQATEEVKIAVANRTDIDTQIERALNFAYIDVATTFRHYELEVLRQATLTSAVRRYTLPSDLRTILSVRDDTNGCKLEKVNYTEFDVQATRGSGPAKRYARFGNIIELDPTPAAAATLLLRHTLRVPEVSGSSVFLTSAEWDEAIVLGAIWRIMKRLNEHEKAESAKNDYYEFVTTRTSPHAIDEEELDEPLGVRIG